MRGGDERAEELFFYVSCESRVPADHPLPPVRAMADEALEFFLTGPSHPN